MTADGCSNRKKRRSATCAGSSSEGMDTCVAGSSPAAACTEQGRCTVEGEEWEEWESNSPAGLSCHQRRLHLILNPLQKLEQLPFG